jgi:sugar phosphate isomerase/epimerase
MTKVGINTYAYAWTTPAIDCVQRLADIGYRSFELLVHPPHLPLEDFDQPSRRRLAAALSEIGAVDCSVNLPSLDHNLASPWPQVRSASIAMFKQTIDLASDLNIPWLVTVPGRMSPFGAAHHCGPHELDARIHRETVATCTGAGPETRYRECTNGVVSRCRLSRGFCSELQVS